MITLTRIPISLNLFSNYSAIYKIHIGLALNLPGTNHLRQPISPTQEPFKPPPSPRDKKSFSRFGLAPFAALIKALCFLRGLKNLLAGCLACSSFASCHYVTRSTTPFKTIFSPSSRTIIILGHTVQWIFRCSTGGCGNWFLALLLVFKVPVACLSFASPPSVRIS